jgi:hypothetical protein
MLLEASQKFSSIVSRMSQRAVKAPRVWAIPNSVSRVPNILLDVSRPKRMDKRSMLTSRLGSTDHDQDNRQFRLSLVTALGVAAGMSTR